MLPSFNEKDSKQVITLCRKEKNIVGKIKNSLVIIGVSSGVTI